MHKIALIATLVLATGALGGLTASIARSSGDRRSHVQGCSSPSWHAVVAPNPKGSWLSAVAAVAPNDSWAVGAAKGGRTPLIEHWDGQSWKVAPNPVREGVLEDVAGSSRDVWAVGSSEDHKRPLIEHWNGSAWSRIPAPMVASALRSVAVISAHSIWAVGDGRAALHWNGIRWEPVRSGGFETSVAALSDTNVWAGGGGYAAPSIEHWAGRGWGSVRTPDTLDDGGNDATYVTGIALLSPRDAWAVGSFTSGNTEVDALIGRWNGKRWMLATTPNGWLSDVAAFSPSDIWTVGYHVQPPSDHPGGALIMHWNGLRWREVNAPTGGNASLNGVAGTSGTDVWAVGSSGRQAMVEHYGCAPE